MWTGGWGHWVAQLAVEVPPLWFGIAYRIGSVWVFMEETRASWFLFINTCSFIFLSLVCIQISLCVEIFLHFATLFMYFVYRVRWPIVEKQSSSNLTV